MPSPCPFALGDVATPRLLCVRHMLRPLLAAPAYNGARRRVIFQTFESCMTDPANRRRSLGLPWIHRRSYSKSQGWPRSSGRRKKCDGRAAHHTSRVAQRRSCELGACEQRWSMTEGTFGMAVATCAYVAPSDRTTIHGRGLAISDIYIVHPDSGGPRGGETWHLCECGRPTPSRGGCVGGRRRASSRRCLCWRGRRSAPTCFGKARRVPSASMPARAASRALELWCAQPLPCVDLS